MLDEIAGSESSLIFVNIMTGITAFFLAIILFAIVNSVDVAEGVFLEIKKLSFSQISIVIFLVFIGFFIHGIRYMFFNFYRAIYKQDNERGYQPLYSKFIFYAFRDGTTIEEIFTENRKKDKSDVFDWIKNSDAPAFDIWVYAQKINNRHASANVYRFYYHSEVFQCLDTLFLFMAIVSVIIKIYCQFVGMLNLESTIRLIIFMITMFMFHRICKGTGKAFIRRFFLEIAVGIKDCPDIVIPPPKPVEEKKQKSKPCNEEQRKLQATIVLFAILLALICFV